MGDEDACTEALVRDLAGFLKRLALAEARAPRRPAGWLKEQEYRTLLWLDLEGPLSVGDLVRRLGVVDARMSRLLRLLEVRGAPFIQCVARATNKRFIDVSITAAGRAALVTHEAARVALLAAAVERLSPAARARLAEALAILLRSAKEW